jgi:hypothetical protein
LKRYKSPGNDQISAEMIHAEGDKLRSEIHKLINSIWNKEKLPDQWKSMLLSCDKNAGQNHDTKTANRSSENVAQFEYLGRTVTNQNLIQEEIKRRLDMDNAFYHSVRTFCLLVYCLKTQKLEYTKL